MAGHVVDQGRNFRLLAYRVSASPNLHLVDIATDAE